MVNEKIDDLLNRLFGMEYSPDGYTWRLPVISKENREQARNTVEAWYLDTYNTELAQLEAKVLMYEEIIKKSTFAPMLDGCKSVPLDEACELIDMNCDYRGDNLLAALACMAEGKRVESLEPIRVRPWGEALGDTDHAD